MLCQHLLELSRAFLFLGVARVQLIEHPAFVVAITGRFSRHDLINSYLSVGLELLLEDVV